MKSDVEDIPTGRKPSVDRSENATVRSILQTSETAYLTCPKLKRKEGINSVRPV